MARLNNDRLVMGCLTAGQIYQLPELTPLPSPNREFQAYDADSGALLWTHSLQATTSGTISVDLDGNGSPEFLTGTADGRLVALTIDPAAGRRVLWEVSLPAASGVPLICDANHDCTADILVSCADGRIYCLMATQP